MKELEIIVEETYKIERKLTFKLSDKQYFDWINGHNLIENTFRKSYSIKDFIERSKYIKKSKKDCGYEKLLLSNYNKDFKHKECSSLDILYINEIDNR